MIGSPGLVPAHWEAMNLPWKSRVVVQKDTALAGLLARVGARPKDGIHSEGRYN